jgi:hypothetical protein
VAPNRFIALVVNGAGVQDALGRAEGVVDHPESRDGGINVGHGLRIVVGVAARHKKAVVALVGGDLLFINGGSRPRS